LRFVVQQGGEALGLEAVGMTRNRAGGGAGLVSAVRGRDPEQDDGANQLVPILLRPREAELERIPLLDGQCLSPFPCGQDITREWYRSRA
jgi:hypothetical protein